MAKKARNSFSIDDRVKVADTGLSGTVCGVWEHFQDVPGDGFDYRIRVDRKPLTPEQIDAGEVLPPEFIEKHSTEIEAA